MQKDNKHCGSSAKLHTPTTTETKLFKSIKGWHSGAEGIIDTSQLQDPQELRSLSVWSLEFSPGSPVSSQKHTGR